MAQGWTSLPDKSEKKRENKQLHSVGPSLLSFAEFYADVSQKRMWLRWIYFQENACVRRMEMMQLQILTSLM